MRGDGTNLSLAQKPRATHQHRSGVAGDDQRLRRRHNRTGNWRFVLVAGAIAVSVPGCAGAGAQIPKNLTGPDTEEQLRVNADAQDGCAFAGTWSYENLDETYGLKDQDVLEVKASTIRGANTELYFSSFLHGYQSAPGYGAIRATIDPGGRTAHGFIVVDWEGWDPPYRKFPISYALMSDGLAVEVTETDKNDNTFRLTGPKLHSEPCGVTLPFVDQVFATVKAANQL